MFNSFFMGGFECSSHRRSDGRRLDILAASKHDKLALEDYGLLKTNGIGTARDGVRWHLVESSQGKYDWSSLRSQTDAARECKIQVIWDLCHYGVPDHVDVWDPSFASRFAEFATAAAAFLCDEGCGRLLCPINEISFWAWAGGDVGTMNPGVKGRGGDLKRQLVNAALVAMRSIRAQDSEARFVFAEPLIHVDGGAGSLGHRRDAESYRLSQFETCDMLSGRTSPELGGDPDFLDVIGVNFYPDNQWYLGGSTIPLGHHAYRPLRAMLAEVYRRYGKPILLSETGAEGTARPAWLHYVVQEVTAAIAEGIPILGVCLYPVLDCVGWEGNRICPVGLFSEADEEGTRTPDHELMQELRYQQGRFGRTSSALPHPPLRLVEKSI